MKSSWFKQLIPHGAAVLIFLVVAFVYCKPVLEGKVVAQHDVTHWKGSIQQSVEYAKTHDGVYPLWTNSMFSGMPTFQIGYSANNKVPWIAHQIFSLGLPKPVNFFFLACVCFYFLTVVLKIRPVFGILGSLAFAYATYNPVIIAVGHDTKMLTMAYMPALLGSLILIYEKKYWLGAGLTALFTSVLITQNHPQIAYYLFLAIAIMTIFYLIRWIRNKEWRHIGMTLTFTLVAAATGVLTNAVSLLSTYEYQKETIRGGKTDLTNSSTAKDDVKTGLTKDYAFSYSVNITEPLVMMVPRMYGGSSDHLEIKEEKSKAIEAVRSMPQEAQQFIFQSLPYFSQTDEGEIFAKTYWGGIGGTSGPPYVGAIICFLAILALFVLDNKHKWWILTTVVLTIMMSWGGNFESFNTLLYKYLPLYNKFRAPSMILVIPQLLLPVLAVLGLNKLADNIGDKKINLNSFKKGGIATAAVFLLLFILYFSFDFYNESARSILKNPNLLQQPQALEVVRRFLNALAEDRKALMLNDILRSLGFIAVAGLFIFLLIRGTLKPLTAGILLAVAILIDVLPIDSTYLNYNKYKDQADNSVAFVETNADKEILADKSFFRVFNDSDGPTVDGDVYSENITSYYYNSIGGYHPAKIRIYQDLIENKSLKENNNAILNMLNAKYLIKKNPNGQTMSYIKNDGALGNCWLVKNILYVNNAKAEMDSLDSFDPKETAIINDTFKSSIPFAPVADSTATISLVKNDNDVVTYSFNAGTNQFAVFSEVYYKSGWKAYIDGKEAPIVKVNYILRGLSVPAGKHDIKFEFKPQGYYQGRSITSIFSIVLIAILVVGIFMEWRNRKQTALANRV